MKTLSLLWLLLNVALLFHINAASPPTGDTPPSNPSEPLVEQQYLFERSYDLFNGQSFHKGFYIDRKGSVYTYKYGPDDAKWHRKNKTALTEQDLKDKYESNKKLVGTVKPKFLLEKIARIKAASLGKQSDTLSGAADEGVTYRICYLYNSETKTYREVELRVNGGFRRENLSPRARELADWLDSFKLEP